MHPLFVLHPPLAPPQPPTRWSYSALKEWRACQRRWVLRRSRYPNIATVPYPERYGTAALHGRLVHEAVEAFLEFRRQHSAESFPLRNYLRARLNAILAEDGPKNPRLDVAGLRGAVSLDVCAARFQAILERMGLADVSMATTRAPSGVRGDEPPAQAEEWHVEVDDPPLMGRIDQIRYGTLTDYKTGEVDESHSEQLRFYALLWWLRYGQQPLGLRLVYSDIAAVAVEVPSATELRQQAESLREEIRAAALAIVAGGTPTASETTCRFCPVRQLCSEYWSSADTLGLRSIAADSGFADLRVTRIPDAWAPGQVMTGTGVVELGGGELSAAMVIDRSRCPTEMPIAARVLGAKVVSGEAGLQIRTTPMSEVFWELGGDGAS